jgi:type III pantothenate kinase
MVLVTDIGNTRIKVAVFELDRIIFQEAFPMESIEKKMNILFKNFPNIKNWVLSSVKNTENWNIEVPKDLKMHLISRQDVFPFVNLYKTPQTLGIDRMVLAAGATLQFPNTNRLVIDAGTCITFDWINQNDAYLGGAISPGLQMRYNALNTFTDKLPLLNPEWPISNIGDSTASSIHVGVSHGIIAEIENYITQITNDVENFTIILTGGDTDFLAKRLKNTIFANSNFLIESLYLIFQYKIHNG